MFTIGEFSKLSGVSPRMLRHYEALGLFCPAEVGPDNGYRYYTAAQLPELRILPAALCLGPRHAGPLERITGAYDALAAGLEANPQYVMEPVSYQRFLVNPHAAAAPEDIETEIFFPVRQRA